MSFNLVSVVMLTTRSRGAVTVAIAASADGVLVLRVAPAQAARRSTQLAIMPMPVGARMATRTHLSVECTMAREGPQAGQPAMGFDRE